MPVSMTECHIPSAVPEPGDPAKQTSADSLVAPIVLLAIVLSVVVAVLIIGAVYFIRRGQKARSLPTVAYKSDGDYNDNKDVSLGRDLSIANPNYDSAALQSNA